MQRTDIVFGSTKTYGASVGLSTVFRQWRATHSHCQFLHGYALQFKATFEATSLDTRNWVIDFGSLKDFKKWLEYMFDHTLLVARDDPNPMGALDTCHYANIAQVRSVEAVGCEQIALLVFEWLEEWLVDTKQSPRVSVVKLEVREHEGNSAYVRRRIAGEQENRA